MDSNRPVYFVIPLLLVFSLAIFASSIAQPKTKPYRLSFYPSSFTIHSGEESVLYVEIENDCEYTISGLRISLEPEKEFIHSIEPRSVENLDPGMSRQLKLVLQPAKSIFRNEHNIIITAASSDYSFRDEVKLTVLPYKGFWTIAAIVLALCIIALFVIVYLVMRKE